MSEMLETETIEDIVIINDNVCGMIIGADSWKGCRISYLWQGSKELRNKDLPDDVKNHQEQKQE